MELNSLDLKKLRAFHLVGKHGNLRLAALRLNQTIPAISAKLRLLEKDLGVDLFERLPNRLILTPAGASFLQEVDAVFERAQRALATLTPRDTLKGRLSLSMGSDHSWSFAPRISNFLRRYPEVELSLYIYKAAEALLALNRGELDLSVGIFPSVPKSLERETMVETTLSLVCLNGHPLLRTHAPSLGDVARHRLIVLPRHAESRKLVDLAMAKAAVRPKSVIEVANCRTAKTFAENGVGVAICHTLCIEHERPRKLRIVDIGNLLGKIGFAVVYRKGGTRSPLINGILEELASQ
jgi:DNA-binding transcriptional LysR family regulator